MYIAMKALSVPARYYYVRGLSLLKQEGMDGGCGPVSYIIVPPDLNCKPVTSGRPQTPMNKTHKGIYNTQQEAGAANNRTLLLPVFS